MNWSKTSKEYTEEHNRTRGRDNEMNKNKNLENTTESGYGEMLYIEPNEGYRRNQMMSPVTEGRQTVGGNTSSRSPTGVGRSVIVSVRNDLNERVDTAQLVGQKGIPTLAVTIPSRGKTDERAERSPKTINMMDTEKETEYNIRTVNARRSPQNPVYQTYTITQEQQGNLALDQPMASGSFIHQPEYNTFQQPNDSNLMVTSMIGGQKSSGGVGQHSVMMNMREGREQVPVMYKMSPNKNMDEFNSSGEKYDTQTNLNNLKNQMDRNVHTSGDQTEGEKSRPMKTDIHHIEDMIKAKEGRDISDAEVKRLVKKLTKVYDPQKTTEGALINTNQSIIVGSNDEIFNDRYKVLQKMNKLSSILLAKEKQDDRYIYPREEEKRTFDRNTLNQSTLKKDSRLTKTPQHKFLYVSLAMISSKGPNCEDRIILRKMRFEKGGVVDLAQEIKTSKKFSVHKISRKAPPTGTKMQRTNPKYREKAAKIVQGWWRDLRDRYRRILKKIILIQSFWRGRWVRKYMYDIIYISLIYQTFCQRIQRALVQHVRPYVWDKFFEGKRSALDALSLLFQKDHRFRAIKIRPYWETWKNVLANYRNKNLKSKKLVNIRSTNDDKLLAMLRAFNRWRILSAFNKMVNKAKDVETTQRKFFGMTKIMNGTEKLAKRTGLKTVKPQLEIYLANQLQRKAVSMLLRSNPKLKRIILRNYFEKWTQQVRKGQLKDLMNKIFYGRINIISSKMYKNFLRKYFLAWWRKLPKNLEMNYFNGSSILQIAVWRKTFQDPLDAMKEKEELGNIKNRLQRIFGVKNRQIRYHWRDYLLKWRNIAQRLKDGDIKNRLSYSLLSTMLNKRRNRILSNRFNHWRKVPKINMADIFDRFRKMIDFSEKVIKRGLLPVKKDFFDRLGKTVTPKTYKTAIEFLSERYVNNNRFLKRYYMNKWRRQGKEVEIYDLKIKVIKAVGGQNEIKERRLSLAKGFRKWDLHTKADNILNQKSDNDKFKEILLQKQLASRLFINIKKHLDVNNKDDALRIALLRWRNKNNLMKKKEDDGITKAAEHLKKHNIKTNGPDLLRNLGGKSLLNKKTKVLRSMPPKYKKGEKFNLLRYFLRWKLRVRDLRNRDTKVIVKKKVLFALFKADDNKEGLIKAWYKWKGVGSQKKSNFPIIVGAQALKRLFTRDSFKKLIKKTEMMNLLIPRHMSFQSAILRGKKNFGKSIFFRNFCIRPYWKRWKIQKVKGNNYDIKVNVMKRIFLKDKGYSKVMLRRAFNRWMKVCNTLSRIELNRQFHTRLLKNLYDKNSKIGLRRAFYKWKENYKDYIKRLNDAGLAAAKLRRVSTKPVLDKFKRSILSGDKYNRIKLGLIQAFRHNDLGNLAFCFKRWRDRVQKLRELRLKCIVLKNIALSLDDKSNEYFKNRLHEALLRWRINAAPNKTIEKITKIREGEVKLVSSLIIKYGPKLLKGIQERARHSRSRNSLYHLYKKLDPNFDKKLLYIAFQTWKDKLPDTERMKQKLKSMVERDLVKPIPHNTLIREPALELVDAMRAYDLLKRDKAKPISAFCRALLNIRRQLGILKRNLILRKKLNDLDLTFKRRYPAAFSKWVRTVQLMKANGNSKTIQHFLKGKMGRNKEKNDKLLNGLKLLEIGVKRKVIKKIKKYGIWQLIKRALIRSLNNKNGADKKTLRNYFLRWRNLLPYLRRDDAATIIQNNYRNYKARDKVRRLRGLSQKMKYLVLRLFAKYLDKRKIAFSKWLLETQRARCNENAKTIQQFLGKHLINLNKKLAKEKLRRMFRMFIIKKLKDAIIKSSKITGDKGAKLYTTLEDIYIRRPYHKLINGMTWIGRISLLKRIQPKIRRALRHHYLPYYLRRWYKNTVEDRLKKIIRMQNWFRARCLIWKKKAELRRNFLLGKFLRKLTDDADLQLRIPFKLWEKRAKFEKLNDQATIVQKIWRGNTSKRNVERLLNQKRIKDLLRKGLKNQLAEKMREADRQFAAPLRRNLKATKGLDKRYSTNNVIDFANDALRNKYLFKLTGNKAFTDRRSLLRYYFDLWRKNSKKVNDAAIKVQKVFKGHMQRKRVSGIQLVKDNLLTIVFKCCRSDVERLNAAFRKWQLRSHLLKCDEHSKIIQDYIIPRLERLLNYKFSNWFINHAKRLAKRRLNTEGKLKKLRDAILRMNIREFIKRLGNKSKYDKLRWILLRKFKDLDSDLASLYLKKYFNDWKRKAKLLTTLLNDAALLLQRNFKMYLAKLFLAKLRNKKARILRLLLKLINDNDLKKQVAFHIWRANANAIKLDESSKVIQDFMDDIKKKLDNNKKRKLRKRLSDGMDKLGNLKFFLRSAFYQIRSKANRQIFTKFNEDLKNKRDDHVKYAYKKIQEREKDVLLNRLLKIPKASRLRLLSKWFNRWKDQANKLGRKQAASMIQKNYRIYIGNKKGVDLKDNLNHILITLHVKNDDLLGKYFNRWRSNIKKMNVLKAGNKIGRFVDDKLKDRRARRNWHKFADNLNINNKDYGALRLLRRLKVYMGLDKLFKLLGPIIKKNGYYHLLDQLRKLGISNKLRLIFNNFERRKEILSLQYYFDLWKKNARKLTKRNEALERAVKAMDNRRKIIAADTINSAFLIKKLFNTIPKIRALEFFKRLRAYADRNNRLKAIGDALVKSRDDLIDKNKKTFIDKIYKLYVYKIIDKFFDRINRDIQKTKLLLGRRLLDRLKAILEAKSGFNYKNARKSKGQGQTSQMTFKSSVKNPKKTFLNNNPVKFVMPYFVEYLEGKLRGRKKDAFDKLNADSKASRFCKLYKTHSNKAILKPKRELYEKMRDRSNELDKLGPAQLMLFKLLRRKWVHHVCEGLKDPVRRFRIIYLIKMTRMHKEIARLRYFRELIRKWRFLAFSKRLARKKLEVMYKSFHCGYLQMANEVFGDEDEINPSIIKEFERFGAGMGMFINENPLSIAELAFCKGREVKYQFESTEMSEEYFEESKKENQIIGENTDYYVDEEIGIGTLGKYQSTTQTKKAVNNKK